MNHLDNSHPPFSSLFRAYLVSEDESGIEKRTLLPQTVTEYLVNSCLQHKEELGLDLGKRIRISEQGIYSCQNGTWSQADEKSRAIGKELLGQIEECLHSPKLPKDKKESLSKICVTIEKQQSFLMSNELGRSSFSIFLDFWREQARLVSLVNNEWERNQWAARLEQLVKEDHDRILLQLEHYRNLEQTTASFQSFINNCYEMLEVGLGLSFLQANKVSHVVDDKAMFSPTQVTKDDVDTVTVSFPLKDHNSTARGVTSYPQEIHEAIRAEKSDLSLAIQQYEVLITAEREHINKLLLAIHAEEVNKNYIYNKCKAVLRRRDEELVQILEEMRQGDLQDAIDHYVKLAEELNKIATYMNKAGDWGQTMNNRMKSALPIEFRGVNEFLAFFAEKAKEFFAVPRPAKINGHTINVANLQNLYHLDNLSDLGNTYKAFEEGLQGLYKFRNLVGLISSFMTNPENKRLFIQNLKAAHLDRPAVAYFFDHFVPLYRGTEEVIHHLSGFQEEWALQLKEIEVLKLKIKKIEESIQQCHLFDAPVFTGGVHERLHQMIQYLEDVDSPPTELINAKELANEVHELQEKYQAIHQKTAELSDSMMRFFNSENYVNFLSNFIEVKDITDTCQVFIDSGDLQLTTIINAITTTYDELSRKPNNPVLAFTNSSFLNANSLFFTEIFQHLVYVHNNLINNEILATFIACQNNKLPDEIGKREKESAIPHNSAAQMALAEANKIESNGRILKTQAVTFMLDHGPSRTLKPIQNQNRQKAANEIGCLVQQNKTPNENRVKKQKTNIISISDVFNQHLLIFNKIKILKKYLEKCDGKNMEVIYQELDRLYEELSQKEEIIERFHRDQLKSNNQQLGKIQSDLRDYFKRLRKETEIGPKKEQAVVS